eukprot:gene12105-biopygen3
MIVGLLGRVPVREIGEAADTSVEVGWRRGARRWLTAADMRRGCRCSGASSCQGGTGEGCRGSSELEEVPARADGSAREMLVATRMRRRSIVRSSREELRGAPLELRQPAPDKGSGKRDPSCSNGAPRSWENTPRSTASGATERSSGKELRRAPTERRGAQKVLRVCSREAPGIRPRAPPVLPCVLGGGPHPVEPPHLVALNLPLILAPTEI